MEWARVMKKASVSVAGLGRIMMDHKNAAFYVQTEPSKMRKDKSLVNHAQDQKILGP